MSYLEKFTKEQQELMISLPFRVGLMVSESDDEGGEESQEAELRTLEILITGYTEDFIKSEFVEELMKQTIAHKEKWDIWSEKLDHVNNECIKALGFINDHLDQKDSLSFRQSLMEIAKAVALAYREIEEEDMEHSDKIRIYGKYYWDMAMSRLKNEAPPNLDEYLNISKTEREVLISLSEALLVDLEGNPLDIAA